MNPNDQLFDAIVRLSVHLDDLEVSVMKELDIRLNRLVRELDRIIQNYSYLVASRRVEGEIIPRLVSLMDELYPIVRRMGERTVQTQVEAVSELLGEAGDEDDPLGLLIGLVGLGSMGLNRLIRPSPGEVFDQTRLGTGATPAHALNRVGARVALKIRQNLMAGRTEVQYDENGNPILLTTSTLDKRKDALRQMLKSELNSNDTVNLRKNVQSVVSDTLVNTFNQSLVSLVQKNPVVFQGEWLWSAILDTRACSRCLNMHGKVTERVPPMHMRCRCLAIPVIRGFGPAEVDSFEDWFRNQSEDYQRRILRDRYDSYVSGRLSIRNYVSLVGRF